MEHRNEVSGLLLVLAATILWGTVGPAQVLAASPAAAPALGGARIVTGGLVLAAVTLARRRGAFRAPPQGSWRPLLAASAATGVFQAAFMTSVGRTGAAVATVVALGVAPVATGACERAVTGTRLTRRWIAGTACAVAGCALVVVPDGSVRVDPSGVVLAVLAGCCFGVYTVSAKRMIRDGAEMRAAAALTLLLGGLALAPWTVPALPSLVTTRSLLLIAWLGPVTAGLAYLLFVTGLRRVTAATAGTLALTEPLVAAALAVTVLGERMSAPVAAGAALLLGGLAVVSVPGRRPARPPARIRTRPPRRVWRWARYRPSRSIAPGADPRGDPDGPPEADRRTAHDAAYGAPTRPGGRSARGTGNGAAAA